MAWVKEKTERIVFDEVDVCECDQCGKRVTVDRQRLDYPNGWVLARVSGTPIQPLDSDPFQTLAFCSWACLSTYAAARAQSRIAVSV